MPDPEASEAEPYAPLAGTKVIEWAGVAAGPFAGKMLAALGADVIKIEPPLRGDGSRSMGPFPDDLPDGEKSALFLYLNNGKRSITLDPATSDGRAILLRLIAEWADLFIEDRPVAFMERHALTYATLAEIVPALVMVSITPFGQTGPYRDFTLYPSQTSHAGGAAYNLPDGLHYTERHRPPLPWPRFISDYSAGVQAAGAALAALLARGASGRGQHVDMSKQQTQMHPLRYAIDAYANDGVPYARHRTLGPLSGTYACADGYVSMFPTRDAEAPINLTDWLGAPEWSKGERWRDPAQRNLHIPEFQALIAEELKRYTMDEIYHGLQAKNVVVGPLYTASNIARSPQFASRRLFQSVRTEAMGELPYPVLPFKFSPVADRAPGVPPRLGQHNQEVFTGLLQLPAAELAQLRALGVV